MTLRLAALSGSLPVLVAVTDELCIGIAQAIIEGFKAFFRDVELFVKSLPLLALIGITLWSCTHHHRLSERIAREGCPFSGDGGIGREREMRELFCK